MMRCYYCAQKIEEGEKSKSVGIGKEIHEKCVEAYRLYLKEVVDLMNEQAKGRMN